MKTNEPTVTITEREYRELHERVEASRILESGVMQYLTLPVHSDRVHVLNIRDNITEQELRAFRKRFHETLMKASQGKPPIVMLTNAAGGIESLPLDSLLILAERLKQAARTEQTIAELRVELDDHDRSVIHVQEQTIDRVANDFADEFRKMLAGETPEWKTPITSGIEYIQLGSNPIDAEIDFKESK